MRKKIIVILVSVLFLAASSSISFAHQSSWKKSKGRYGKLEEKIEAKAHMFLKNKEELGLSDEQVQQIKALKLQAKKESIKQNAEIEVIGLDIKSQMWEDVIDAQAISVLIDKKYEIKKGMAKSLINVYAELKTILTDRQKTKLKELYKKCKTEDKKSHR